MAFVALKLLLSVLHKIQVVMSVVARPKHIGPENTIQKYTPSFVFRVFCKLWRLVGLFGPATGPLQWNIASRTSVEPTGQGI